MAYKKNNIGIPFVARKRELTHLGIHLVPIPSSAFVCGKVG